MQITKQELIELNACEEGLDRFMLQTGNTDEPVNVASLVSGKNTYVDLLWLAGEKIPKERIVRFACDCALINIELIKPYTDKYDMIVEFLHDPTAYAAYAARAAAYAARAADAADAADADAAARAAYAAYAADAAADAAAYAAAAAAVRAAAYAAAAADADAAAGSCEKVNALLVKLFE